SADDIKREPAPARCGPPLTVRQWLRRAVLYQRIDLLRREPAAANQVVRERLGVSKAMLELTGELVDLSLIEQAALAKRLDERCNGGHVVIRGERPGIVLFAKSSTILVFQKMRCKLV